jgi:hypothetical protein
MSSLDKYVIHQAKPFRLAILILIAVAITAASVWYYLKDDSTSLQENLIFLEKNLNLSRQNSQQLSDESLDLREQNRQLNDTTSIQLQELNIQQATVDQLQQQIVDLQDQVITLNKELMFYQNITQGATSTELQIRELHLTADAEQADVIHYRLVITQGKNIAKPVTGSVVITVDKNKKALTEQPLNLRYVQLIEGRLTVADSSQKKSITVTIMQDKKPKLSRTFDWQLTPTNQ